MSLVEQYANVYQKYIVMLLLHIFRYSTWGCAQSLRFARSLPIDNAGRNAGDFWLIIAKVTKNK